MTKQEDEHCNHGVEFDPVAAEHMTPSQVREKFPRFFGICSKCGYNGIYYCSYHHYLSGDW